MAKDEHDNLTIDAFEGKHPDISEIEPQSKWAQHMKEITPEKLKLASNKNVEPEITNVSIIIELDGGQCYAADYTLAEMRKLLMVARALRFNQKLPLVKLGEGMKFAKHKKEVK